jgi:hypothetical protein
MERSAFRENLDGVAQDGLAGLESPDNIASTPSRNRASVNLSSALTWRCTRSLKLFVFAIVLLRSAPSRFK